MGNWDNLTPQELSVYNLTNFPIGPIDVILAQDVLNEGMNQIGIKHWISSGTLLGFYRDKGFIPHDTDLDVNVFSDRPVLIKPVGFEPIRSMTYRGHPMQTAYMKKGVIFDIYYFYEDGDCAINCNEYGIIRKPMRFLETLGELEFNGCTYPTPSPIEEFLTWRFGDWKTPVGSKQSWEKDATHLTLWKNIKNES